MAVTEFKEIHTGRDGGVEMNDKEVLRRYTRVFRVRTDTATDDPTVILTNASCPRLGSYYPTDNAARCRRVRPRNESFSKLVWIVTCGYSTKFEIEEDPLDDPPRITWNTDIYQRPYTKDRTGKAILNAAGEAPDPPLEGDDSQWHVQVVANVAAVPTWIKGYRNAINDGAIIIDGIEAAEEEAKLHRIAIGEEEERNDVVFRVFTMQVKLRDHDLQFNGWQEQVLNAGLQQRVETTPGNFLLQPCWDKDRKEVTSPVLLTATGTQMENPTPDSATYVDGDIYNPKDFTVLPAVSAVV